MEYKVKRTPKVYWLTVMALALAFATWSRADEGSAQEADMTGNSAFFVSALEPLPALVGAHIFQAITPNLRLGVSLGTSAVGYTSGITYGFGAQYILSRGKAITPVFGATLASGLDLNGVRRQYFYATTGVDVNRSNGLVLGFGLNWSLSQVDGQNLVLPFFRLGSTY